MADIGSPRTETTCQLETVTGEPTGALVEAQRLVVDLVEGDPAMSLGFMIGNSDGTFGSPHQVADVEVEMVGLGPVSIHEQVNINVERLGPDFETRDTGLLLGLLQSNLDQMPFPISVTAGLEPTADLGVQ
jgi:hypothetical protein